MFIRANKNDTNFIKDTKNKFMSILASLKKRAGDFTGTVSSETDGVYHEVPSFDAQLGGARGTKKPSKKNITIDPRDPSNNIQPSPNQGIAGTQMDDNTADKAGNSMPANEIGNGVAGPSASLAYPEGDKGGTGNTMPVTSPYERAGAAYRTNQGDNAIAGDVNSFLTKKNPPQKPGAAGAIERAQRKSDSIANSGVPGAARISKDKGKGNKGKKGKGRR
jgi:hypothetical protein